MSQQGRGLSLSFAFCVFGLLLSYLPSTSEGGKKLMVSAGGIQPVVVPATRKDQEEFAVADLRHCLGRLTDREVALLVDGVADNRPSAGPGVFTIS